MKDIYVVTGGPGFGKTSVLMELRSWGYNASDELSRLFIKEQMEGDGALLPWVNRLGYSEEMLKRRITQYENMPINNLWFFDRGIPDLIAYIIKDKLNVPEEFYKAASEYRYMKTVFLTPPWKQIYVNDRERLEQFEEAEFIHKAIERTYTQLGYKCISLPKTTIFERVEFILNAISSVPND